MLAYSRATEPAPPYKKLTFSILEDYDKGASLDSIARDFRLMRELGITTWRGSFGWDDYEPEPGKYDFDWLKRFVETAARNGIKLRPYIAFTPQWAGRGGKDQDAFNDPPRDLDRWTAFVSHLATALRDYPNVLSYEIYNEENVQQWWEGTPAEYANVLKRAAAAIRAADPGVQVILGGATFPDTNWLDAICETEQAGSSFDVVPFHAYPETWTPPNVTVENYLTGLPDFLSTVRAGCGGKRVWINETGYATIPGRTEAQQADWWVRAVATFAAAPGIENIGVYEMRDLTKESAAIGDAPNYYLGLLHTDGRRKQAFRTVQMLVRLLGTDSVAVVDSDPIVSPDSGVYHHLFRRPDGTRVLIVWTRRPSVRAKIHLSPAPRRVVAYTLEGDSTLTRALGPALQISRGQPRVFTLH